MTTISAQIIADSLSPHGKRLTTLQLRYPRFIHAEFMTHRAFSRNASSSRAIPVERMIEDIIADTAMPKYWGANQRGMQAGEEIDTPVNATRLMQSDRKTLWGFGEFLAHAPENINIGAIADLSLAKENHWNDARDFAIYAAWAYHNAGYHKQIVNRLLEPFMHINVVVTATEWDNFFHLRDHKDAEPHIQELARTIRGAMAGSEPEKLSSGEWHLPYIRYDDRKKLTNYGAGEEDTLAKISAARCARVSYLTHDGRETTFEEDVALYERLVGDPMHASPMEHQAYADHQDAGTWREPELWGNLVGWCQYRKMLEPSS